jgi:prepilin-type N-terminal cleavage/methylation domain-containing protein
MKTKLNRSNPAFTLIEMIGVLAIIAVLVAVLVPKIFSAINDSRFSSSVASINSCKAATMSYFGANSGFGTNTAISFDKTLVSSNYLETPLVTKMGTTNWVQVVGLASSAGGTPYTLDGVNQITGTTVVEAVLENITAADAMELSRRIDTSAWSTITATNADTMGRVEYAKPTAVGTTTVYVYLAHQ